MTKKYVILHAYPDENGMELVHEIYKDNYFDNEVDALRVCNELEDTAEYAESYDVTELTPYHEEDKPYIEGSD